jgi:hypothetical protein
MTTPSRPTCRAPARSPRSLAPLGLTWSCNSRANLDYDTIKSFKDNGLRLFLVGYESGNEQILKRIKKGVTTDEMRRFTGLSPGGGGHSRHLHPRLPVETKETIEQTIRFAQELDVFSIRSASPRPIPAPSCTNRRASTAGSPKDKTDIVETTASSKAPSSIPS